MRPFSLNLVAVGLLFVLAGCAGDPGAPVRRINPDEAGAVTGLGFESQNLQEVADKMFRSILQTPAITQAGVPPTVVLLPFENQTRFPFNQQLLLTLLKARLNSQAPGKMKFLARDRLADVLNEREMKRQGQVTEGTGGSSPATYGATYFLTGRLAGISQAGTRGASDYILVTYQLINSETSEEMWEDFAEIKKEGRDDVIYR